MSRILSPDEAAALSGLPRSTIVLLCRRGDIPAAKMGRRWLIREDALLSVLPGPILPSPDADLSDEGAQEVAGDRLREREPEGVDGSRDTRRGPSVRGKAATRGQRGAPVHAGGSKLDRLLQKGVRAPRRTASAG